MNALTMKQAIAAGLTRYFTGKECPRGHIAERIVSTRACSACAAERKVLWNKGNPDKVLSQKRNWRAANVEHARALNLANQKLHRAAANARNRRYAAATREKQLARVAAYALAHPERGAIRSAKHRAAKIRATPKWADHDSINMIYQAAAIARVSGFDVHVDHAIPLQGRLASGLHVHTNLQLLDARANRSKSNHI